MELSDIEPTPPEDFPDVAFSVLGFDSVDQARANPEAGADLPKLDRPELPFEPQAWQYLPEEPIDVSGVPVFMDPAKLVRPEEPLEVSAAEFWTGAEDISDIEATEIFPDQVVPRAELVENTGPVGAKEHRIRIDPNTNTGQYLDGVGAVIMEFDVATGDTTGVRYGRKFFTATGDFRVDKKYANMYYQYPNVKAVPGLTINAPKGISSKGEPGKGKMAVHGTFGGGAGSLKRNRGRVSHGCVRMLDDTIKRLYELVDVGTLVEILPYRDENGELVSTEHRRLGKPEYKRRDVIIRGS